jgi:hypothetical protein
VQKEQATPTEPETNQTVNETETQENVTETVSNTSESTESEPVEETVGKQEQQQQGGQLKIQTSLFLTSLPT